jgi:ABC-type multidrug transport system fused ATPase/permease subunit
MRALRELAAGGLLRLPRATGALLAGCAAAPLYTAAQTAIPLVTGSIVDQALLARDPRALTLRVALLVGLAAASAAGRGLHQTAFARLGERTRTELQLRLLGRLHALPIAYFDSERSGRIQSLLREDAASVGRLGFEMLSEALLGALQLGLMLTVLTLRYGRAVLVGLALIPIYTVLPALFARRLRRAAGDSLAATAEVASALQESIQGVREVRVFGREGWAVERLRGLLGGEAARQGRVALLRAAHGLDYVIYFLAGGLVYWWGGQSVFAGRLSVGALVALVALLANLESPVARLTHLSADYQRLMAAAERIAAAFRAAPGVAPGPAAAGAGAALAPGGHRVRFDGVEFAYAGAAAPVLRQISFSVEAGERVAIVGPSGAGKSTLVGLLARLHEPRRGRVLIDGRDLRTLALDSLRQEVGFVMQDTMLFAGTVRDNLRFGRLDATDAELVASARAANADEFIARLERGYDTEIGERGVQLSGGQRQRIGIARVLLRRPGILVLDEATSSLDGAGERQVRQALERLMAGRTTFVVSHRPAAFAGADRIVVLDRGRIVGIGRHHELLAVSAVYRGLAGEGEAGGGGAPAMVAGGGAAVAGGTAAVGGGTAVAREREAGG